MRQLFALLAPLPLFAQDALPDLIVTASRFPEHADTTHYSTTILTEEELRNAAARTLPQAFLSTPGVLVQQTTPGHGSPFIRGFTGRRNLLLQDGIRLNNSTWRGGPVQYWNTLDSQAIDRLELVKSQGSVLYGSDAIGGTLNTLSRGSGFQEEESFFSHGAATYRFDTNSESHLGRLEHRLGVGQQWGVLLGISAKEVGDIRDSALGTMRGTGYQEESLDFKFEYAISDSATLTLAHQRLDQDEVPRWHSTINNPGWRRGSFFTTPGTDLERVLDQQRTLSYLKFEDTDSPLKWINRWSATLSYQDSLDREFRVRGSGQSDLRISRVDTYGLNFQAESELGPGNLLWGTDYYHDEVDTEGFRNGAPRPANRPVADDSTYDSLGIFAAWSKEVEERYEFTLGARYTYARAEWNGYRPAGATEDQSGEASWDDLSLSARGVYFFDHEWSAFGGLSQAFRAPNLDDLTGSQFALNGLDSNGSPSVDQENYLTAELGLRFRKNNLSAQISGYHTWIDDGIVRIDDGSGGLLTTNGADGYLYGFEAETIWKFHDQWELSGSISWQDGQQEQPLVLGGPLVEDTIRRLNPLSGTVALKWTHPSEKFWISGRLLAADTQDRLSSRASSDTQRIPVGGTPGYLIGSIYAGWQARENLAFNLALENLTDEDYRIHGSGQNQPGINATFSVKLDW